MIKDNKVYIILPLTITMIGYLLTSFVLLESNPFEWEQEARVITSVISGISFIISLMIKGVMQGDLK